MAKPHPIFRRHIALPSDHGSWVFLLSPLLIGIFAGGAHQPATTTLIIAALAAFFLRQPTVIAVKAYAGRRSRQDLPAARFWMIVYSLIALIALTLLIKAGYAVILSLALPGLLVFAWHLWLVYHRAERNQALLDILASGALALAAPAALWVGLGQPHPHGWWLWILIWAQSAASIRHAFMRLEQRTIKQTPPLKEKLNLARRALIYTNFNFLAVLILSLTGILPPLLYLPYALQSAETLSGAFQPAIGHKPTHIGIRQLIVSTIFTILFILTWN